MTNSAPDALLLLQAKSSHKLRQQPWDKMGEEKLSLPPPTHSHQEEDGEEAGDGYGVVCSFSVLCPIFK
ncbi:hypothetical protein AMELA_G00203850 [Ameiurus melas]|uniref:Uncharacterized protein n=1 Tax=Ameiurus melas TaxID=219545 RepID=A0A7J6A2G8_AMEME|nr:hypothetical protein AMELA_G00203850 [Ameiurus melas]